MEVEPAPANQKNGKKRPVFFASQTGPRPRKLRAHASASSISSQVQEGRNRDFSLTAKMGNLSIEDDEPPDKRPQRGQVILRQGSETPCPSRRSDVPMEHRTSRSGRRDEMARTSALRSTDSQGASMLPPPPKTPSRDQSALVEVDALGEMILTARKTPFASPAKSCSPCKQPFLTKESSLTGFTAWDVGERLHGIESQFMVMKEAVTLSLTDRKALEEAVDMAKTRGTDGESRTLSWLPVYADTA